MSANERQIADWNGINGARWLSHQERLDRMLAPFGKDALHIAAIRPGEHVMDIGCGAGQTTLAIDGMVGAGGRVRGVDVSEPLIQRARARAAEAQSHAHFDIADASRAPIVPNDLDLLFSRFGVMFFDAPVAAFAHLRRGLKARGRLAFICWRTKAENDWHHLPMQAIGPLLPPADMPQPHAPGPFAFGDADYIRHILSSAGFSDILIAPVDNPIPFGQGATVQAAVDDALAQSFQIGPLTRALADQPESVRTCAIQAVRNAFADHVVSRNASDHGVTINGAAWVVTARNGGS